MKIMKKGKTIVKIKDSEYKKYLQDDYNYAPKSEWKEKVRDVNKKVSEK